MTRSIPDPGFAGDDGGADPTLVAALAAQDRAGGEDAVLRALASARLLVPVVALAATVSDDGPSTGLRRDKRTDMAVVTVKGRDGRLALPVFTGLPALVRWRADARPVPLAARAAAGAAYDEGAAALVIDIAGPVPYVVQGAALRALAEGRSPLAPADDPAVDAAIRNAATLPGILGIDVAPSDGADLAVRLTLYDGLRPEEARATVEAVTRRLADDAVLRSRLVRGLDIAVLGGSATNGEVRCQEDPGTDLR